MSLMASRKRGADTLDCEEEKYKKGDLVYVVCADGRTEIGIVDACLTFTTCRMDSGVTVDGPALRIHSVNDDLCSDGKILKWQKCNHDELPHTEYKHRLKKCTKEEAGRSLYEMRIRRALSHCVNETAASRLGLDPEELNAPLDELLLSPDSKYNLLLLLNKLGGKASFAKICEEVGSPKNALSLIAFLNAKRCAVEVAQWNEESDEATKIRATKGMPNKARGEKILQRLQRDCQDPFKTLEEFNCPSLAVFLTTLAMYNFNPKANPNQGCFNPLLLLNNKNKPQAMKRAKKVVSAASLIHTSTSNDQRFLK